jgi:hypothetical protein
MENLDCMIRNISMGGAKLSFGANTCMPDNFLLQIDAENLEVECERVWQIGVDMGVRFLDRFQPLSKARRRLFAPI